MIRQCILVFCLWASALSGAIHPEVWKEVEPYLLPQEHPTKPVLDEITASGELSVFHDMDTMVAAGFDRVQPQHKTQIIVTRHPRLQGYIIKVYLDVQDYYEGKPEYYYFAKRAEGARLISGAIKAHHYEHLLKVPQKWIYVLPEKKEQSKMFLLIEDDMDILDDAANKKRWGSHHATKELLKALHTVITEFRFKDCAKPANCPFSRDGKVALVDTQSFYKKSVGYYKLTPYLNPEMQEYWKSL